MMYGQNDYGDGFVTIEDLTAAMDECERTYQNTKAEKLHWERHNRTVARDEVFRIAEQIWCEREGWWEPLPATDLVDFAYIFHPPTHGGWVMVPTTTEEMCHAGARVLMETEQSSPSIVACEVFAAMLSAAPSAPVGG